MKTQRHGTSSSWEAVNWGGEGGRNEQGLPGVTILPVDLGREKLQLGASDHHKGVSRERIPVARSSRDG